MGDQIQRGFLVGGNFLPLHGAVGEFDAIAPHQLGMLFDGGVHAAIAQFVVHFIDVVVTANPDLAGELAQVKSAQRAERHLVIGAEDGIDILVLVQQRRYRGEGIFGLPVAADGVDDLDGVAAGERLDEAGLAQLAVFGAANSFDHQHLALALELGADVVAYQRRALGVVGADKWNGDAILSLGVLIKRVVNVDDDDALAGGLVEDRDQLARVGRGNDDGAIAARDQVVDDAGLMFDVGFHLGAEYFQTQPMFAGVGLGAGFHLEKERIRQRFHHQGDFALVGGFSLRRGGCRGQRCSKQSGQHPGEQEFWHAVHGADSL